MSGIEQTGRRGRTIVPIRATDDQETIGTSRYNVPALEKGLDVCELLAREPDGLSVTEMSQRLGRSTGELYRLIQYLDWRGYLERDPDSDRYTLSMRMFRLSHEHPPVRSLTACAVPLMERLAVAIGQSCHLGVLDRASVVIVAQVDSPLPIRYSVRLGAQFPVWETSTGLLIAAHLEEGRRESLVELLERLVDPAELDVFVAKLDGVAAAGYEQRPSELIPGILNISRPIFDLNGQIAAALTVPFMELRMMQVGLEDVTAALARAAASISDALGYNADR